MKRKFITALTISLITVFFFIGYFYILTKAEISEASKRERDQKLTEKKIKEEKRQKKIDENINWNLKALNFTKEEENKIKMAIKKWNEDRGFYQIEYVDIDEEEHPCSKNLFKIRIKYMTTFVIASVEVKDETINISLYKTQWDIQEEVSKKSTHDALPDGDEG